MVLVEGREKEIERGVTVNGDNGCLGSGAELLSHAWGHAAVLTPPQTMVGDVSASRNLTHSFGQFRVRIGQNYGQIYESNL